MYRKPACVYQQQMVSKNSSEKYLDMSLDLKLVWKVSIKKKLTEINKTFIFTATF